MNGRARLLSAFKAVHAEPRCCVGAKACAELARRAAIASLIMAEDERIQTEENIAFLKELDAYHKEYKPVLQEEIDFQKNNRTSTETTIFDMQCNYPLIHEEIEDELERREWFKDTGLGGGGK